MPFSPWLAVTRSGSSVQPPTSSSRRRGSGSIAAEVVSEIGVPGQAARTDRTAAAHGSGARDSRPVAS
jgi:hypothetical protein